MVQIFENKKQSTGQRLSQGLSNALNIGSQLVTDNIQKENQNQAFEKLGLDAEIMNIPSKEAQSEYFKNAFSKENKTKEIADKLSSNRKQLYGVGKSRGLEGNELEDFVNTYQENVALGEKISKPEKKAPVKKSKFVEKKEDLLAQSGVKAIEELPKLQSVSENIKYLKELGGKLTGIVGSGKALLNTGDAAEFNTLSASLLDPVIKVFNPTGTLPEKKLQWIRDNFQPKAGELKSTQDGKIATLERLNNQAIQRAQQKIKLFEDYNGEPPESEVVKFNNETEKFINDLVDQGQYIQELKRELPQGMILMIDPNGNPLHVNPNQQMPDGSSAIEYAMKNGAQLIE